MLCSSFHSSKCVRVSRRKDMLLVLLRAHIRECRQGPGSPPQLADNPSKQVNCFCPPFVLRRKP